CARHRGQGGGPGGRDIEGLCGNDPPAGGSPAGLHRTDGGPVAYTTRVGAGPFPTELKDETGSLIRERGQEFGTTTGRPRRCGWFDAVLARYAAQINGLDSIALTRLDILDSLPTLKICTAYRWGNGIVETLPASMDDFGCCEPVYEEMPGWQSSTAGIRRFEDLPPAAQRYALRLAELVGARLSIVSLGAAREQTIILQNPFEA
ncbi:MAG: adenylosuccinate synthetase, partial [Bacteroidetes bacterium]|nr:adenylosuccinate synthetase [Bacteroidota bacterium]